MPVTLRATAFTVREASLRKTVSCRFMRTVPTTSAPSSIAATSRGISSGGFWRSASRVTTISPRAFEKPHMIALCWP